MNPDKLSVESEQNGFRAAFRDLDEWVEEQEQNKRRGRVSIDLDHLMEYVPRILSAAKNLFMVEVDESKKDELSKIETKARVAFTLLGEITDLTKQISVFTEAKRVLIDLHEDAKKFLSHTII